MASWLILTVPIRDLKARNRTSSCASVVSTQGGGGREVHSHLADGSNTGFVLGRRENNLCCIFSLLFSVIVLLTFSYVSYKKTLSFRECEFSRERRTKFGEFRFHFILHDTVYQQCNFQCASRFCMLLDKSAASWGNVPLSMIFLIVLVLIRRPHLWCD